MSPQVRQSCERQESAAKREGIHGPVSEGAAGTWSEKDSETERQSGKVCVL